MIFLKPPQLSNFALALACFFGSQAFALSSISSLQQELEQLGKQIKSYEVPKDNGSEGLLTFQVDQHLLKAEQSYREREYIAAIRLFNAALNQAPEMDQPRYLKAQYLLGRSYEELAAPPRAAKSYLRYLSSFASQGGESDELLIEVIRRLLLLQESMLAVQKVDFQRLLANLMSLPLASDLKAEVTLLSSIAANHAGHHRLSSDWLSLLHRPDVPRRIQVEVAFYEALNALALGQDAEGEKKLLEVVAFEEPSFLFIRDMAALNLGRLYAARNMPQNAWTWYLKVEGPSQALRYAAYEGVQLLQQNREYAKALQLAKAYLNKYPATREAYRIQERLSFLQMQAGQLDPAEGGMRDRERELHTLQNDVLETYRGQEKMSSNDVSSLRKKTEIMALQSPLLETSAQLYDRLEKAQRRIQEQRLELGSLIFTLGRLSDARLRPEVLATNRQFQVFVGKLFAIGEQLLQHEREIFGERLSSAEKVRLDASLGRRQRLQDLEQEFQKANWQAWDHFARRHLSLSGLAERLGTQRAVLQGLKFNALQDRATPALKERVASIDDLMQRLQALETLVNTRSEQDRLALLEQIRAPSPYQKTRKVLLLGTQEFLESLALFDDYQDRFQDPAHQHLQEDLEKSWIRWQGMAGSILKLIKSDEALQSNWLDQQLAEIRRLMSREQNLAGRQVQLDTLLGYSTAQAMPAILSHFEHHIKEQQSRAKKWLADIQWHRFMKQTEQRFKAKTEQERVEAQLQEKLKDIETERSIYE